MDIQDKKTLFRLLNQYMVELMALDNVNQQKEKLSSFNVGIKAQFNHARCIAKKLGVEIEEQIRTV